MKQVTEEVLMKAFNAGQAVRRTEVYSTFVHVENNRMMELAFLEGLLGEKFKSLQEWGK